jgi:hypothetical protein
LARLDTPRRTRFAQRQVCKRSAYLPHTSPAINSDGINRLGQSFISEGRHRGWFRNAERSAPNVASRRRYDGVVTSHARLGRRSLLCCRRPTGTPVIAASLEFCSPRSSAIGRSCRLQAPVIYRIVRDVELAWSPRLSGLRVRNSQVLSLIDARKSYP